MCRKQYGNNLKFASIDLKNDKEIVLAAVIQNGNALQFASIYCRSNKEIVLQAVKQDKHALKYAIKNLKNN